MRSSRRVRPGCAIDTTPPASWTTATTSAGAAPRRGTKAGAAELQIAGERLVAIGDVAGANQRVGDLRTADAAAAAGGGENRRDVDAAAERRQALAHLADAAQPLGALALEKRAQRR